MICNYEQVMYRFQLTLRSISLAAQRFCFGEDQPQIARAGFVDWLILRDIWRKGCPFLGLQYQLDRGSFPGMPHTLPHIDGSRGGVSRTCVRTPH
jgi:hypothetical protein